MKPIQVLTRCGLPGRWVSEAGVVYEADAEGVVIIPAGVMVDTAGYTVRHEAFEVYPGLETAAVYLYQAGCYVERLADGRFYLLLENCEHFSDELEALADMLYGWLSC